MRILTLENKAFDLNDLPEEIEEDTRFSVLDNSVPLLAAYRPIAIDL